jgi:hypothetical protein
LTKKCCTIFNKKKAEIRSENASGYKLVFVAYKNTWRDQRKKRRMLKNQTDEHSLFSDSLKRKTEQNCERDESKKIKLEACFVKCEVEIKMLNSQVHLLLRYMDGLSKDYMNQILQFIKNKIIEKYKSFYDTNACSDQIGKNFAYLNDKQTH